MVINELKKMKDKERYNPKEYEYVGPEEIYKRIKDAFKGTVVKSSDDILSWIIWSTDHSIKMKFQLRPILSEIKKFYSKPISKSRFKEYLSLLEGITKGDLELPITGFNPMAKDHVIQKIEELEALGAETILENLINEFNAEITEKKNERLAKKARIITLNRMS